MFNYNLTSEGYEVIVETELIPFIQLFDTEMHVIQYKTRPVPMFLYILPKLFEIMVSSY